MEQFDFKIKIKKGHSLKGKISAPTHREACREIAKTADDLAAKGIKVKGVWVGAKFPPALPKEPKQAN
ncbi:hypothetical protein [Runella zeae]|uniref:hypothetical protein n=1 Tax=Runella zeae TaxID=94255 RepID=UPI0023545240|nr:hypothetical protein [Runella zeae]